jgi:hypothetical protein
MKSSCQWQGVGCNSILPGGRDSYLLRIKNVPCQCGEVIGFSQRRALLNNTQ